MEKNDEQFFELHRSDAIQILLSKEKTPTQYTNLKLAELLEEYFPEKARSYIVKEDDIPLEGNTLTFLEF
jgi:hypothetical protein